VRAKEAETGRRIGIYPEIKHPTYFAGIGHDLAALLVAQLHEGGYRSADDPVFIQSFEVTPLQRLNALTELRLVQLIDAPETSPADLPGQTYAAMITPQGLAEIAGYADGIGVPIGLLIDGEGAPTSLIGTAHAAGLQIHGWTARKENAFLFPPLRSEGPPSARGNLAALLAMLQQAGVDGVFTDDPAVAVATFRGAS
jgi:glycerophosphoryl diester phosphodiesterase